MFIEDNVRVEESCLCDPFGVVGVWDLPMAMKFMCKLFEFPFV